MTAKHIDYVSPRGRKRHRALVRRFRFGVFAEFIIMTSVVTCFLLVSGGVILTTYESIAVTADDQGRQRLEEELAEWKDEPEPVDGKSPLYVKYLKSQDFVAIAQEEQERVATEQARAEDDDPDGGEPAEEESSDDADDESDDTDDESDDTGNPEPDGDETSQSESEE